MLELDPMKRISPYEILKSFGIGCEPIRIPSYWFLLEDYAHQIDININNSNLIITKWKINDSKGCYGQSLKKDFQHHDGQHSFYPFLAIPE